MQDVKLRLFTFHSFLDKRRHLSRFDKKYDTPCGKCFVSEESIDMEHWDGEGVNKKFFCGAFIV